MSLRHLDQLFRPDSIAVVGASNQEGTVGRVVMRNLLEGGFAGPILPVNPKHEAVAGVLAYRSVRDLPRKPDLAVVCTPAATVPGVVDELGALGCRAAVVLTAGLGQPESHPANRAGARRDGGRAEGSAAVERTLATEMLAAAGRHGLRILGPNCVGLIAPGHRLNASFAHAPALPGKLAFLSQSGGLCTAILDWARSHGIGFSYFVSLGDQADVDFADVIDWLVAQGDARAILLYVESVLHARKFLSAARAASRVLPIVAIKSGRGESGARAAASHTGALAGSDDVYDAALRRAGILRVDTTDELFAAVETLARVPLLGGERLAIVSNSGGPNVLAADRLERGGGLLAKLGNETLAALDRVLPGTWSRRNPIDLVGDAGGERYRATIEALAADPAIDALLVMHAPTATVSSDEAAAAVVESATRLAARIPVLTAWLGAETVAGARRRFADAGIPTYDTPDDAVDAFLQRVRHRRNQATLLQTPPSAPEDHAPDAAGAAALLEAALVEGRRELTEPESKRLLQLYGVPVLETRVARDPQEAAAIAAEIGFPVAVKVLSSEISHKSDVGGVELSLDSEGEVGAAAGRIAERVARRRPDARLDGFLVQRMIDRPRAVETIVGIATDPLFGPVLLFGHGGTAVEVIGDRAVALPPLNLALARDLVDSTRVSRLLRGYRDRPAADLEALTTVLTRLSQLAIDQPLVRELDVNPLLVDERGVLAVDARVRLELGPRRGLERLAIRPYPSGLEEAVTLGDGKEVLLRPIRPEDEPAHMRLFASLDPESVYFRFFSVVRELPHERMARYTQIDYDREMAFIATRREDHEDRTLGVVRAIFDGERRAAEFAIVVDPRHQGLGLGYRLLRKIIDYCRDQGAERLVGQVLWENQRMRRLAEELGFSSRRLEGNVLEVTLPLREHTADAPIEPARS
jgi:acetyltransferase